MLNSIIKIKTERRGRPRHCGGCTWSGAPVRKPLQNLRGFRKVGELPKVVLTWAGVRPISAGKLPVVSALLLSLRGCLPVSVPLRMEGGTGKDLEAAEN